jgi:type IV pilus assembly protein PilC
MPNYRCKAVDEAGKMVRGTVFALSDDDIEARLAKNGLTLLKCKKLKKGQGALMFSSKVKPRLLIEFYRRLSQALDMGLPILSALDENAKALPSPVLRKVISELQLAVEAGNTVFDSMRRFPKIFQKLDLAIIRLGEKSGVLPQCLKDLSDFMEWKEDIRSTIKRAAIYPFFILIVILGVIGVWVGFVLPQMASFLSDMGVEMPVMTRVVFSTSLFLQANWFWMVAGLSGAMGVVFVFQKTQKGGVLFDKLMLKAPILGAISENSGLARLSHNYATMYKAGMTINDIFDILAHNVLGNRYLEGRLSAAFVEIRKGHPISSGFETAGGFPPLFLGGIRNGEVTGTIDETFDRLGKYYDEEVKRTVQAMVSAFEPMIIIFLGGIFGLVALAIMLPLYDVIGQVGNTY